MTRGQVQSKREGALNSACHKNEETSFYSLQSKKTYEENIRCGYVYLNVYKSFLKEFNFTSQPE